MLTIKKKNKQYYFLKTEKILETPLKNEIMVRSEKTAIKLLKYPVDLIKCDIEGAEWELINDYPNLLSSTKYLLLEWHSWHPGGGSLDQIIERLSYLNFKVEKQSPASRANGRDGKVGLLLASNLF